MEFLEPVCIGIQGVGGTDRFARGTVRFFAVEMPAGHLRRVAPAVASRFSHQHDSSIRRTNRPPYPGPEGATKQDSTAQMLLFLLLSRGANAEDHSGSRFEALRERL